VVVWLVVLPDIVRYCARAIGVVGPWRRLSILDTHASNLPMGDEPPGSRGPTGPTGRAGGPTGATGPSEPRWQLGSTGTFSGSSTAPASVLLTYGVGPTGPYSDNQTPIRPLRATADSAHNCKRCGTPLGIDLDIWPEGPGLVRYQSEIDTPIFCPNPGCSSNSDDDEPRVVRGREDDVVESGVYLVCDPDPPSR
jgi:hypothetical protein